MNITSHAEARAQQRAIPPLILDWLDRYGVRERAGAGAEIAYFDKNSRRALERDVGRTVVARLGDLLDAYAVVDGNTVITVGHRYKRIERGRVRRTAGRRR